MALDQRAIRDYERSRDTSEKDDDEQPEMRSFLGGEMQTRERRQWLKHPAVLSLAACATFLVIFMLGFNLGRSTTSATSSVSVKVLEKLLRLKQDSPPPKQQPEIPGVGSLEISTVFDTLRSLPAIDLYREYGLRHNELSLYPEPLGKAVCLVDVDTRPWKPHDYSDVNDMKPLHWGYLNHYLYAKLHGYTYKHVQVPELPNLNTTWVKVKELYRMTMRDDCQFVIMLDGDIIFPDLRIPMEALMSHWNITKDIMIAGGTDLPRTHDFTHEEPHFNTGFLITQNTPTFPSMMQDWIDCPTDVKYKTCSKWRYRWAREQAAFSSYIRYDEAYKPYIRQMPLEEVHQGRFTKHYWGPKKVHLAEAARNAVLDRFIPDIYRGLLDDWSQVYEKTTPRVYRELQQKYKPKVDNKENNQSS